jgi:hypothetical protein
VAYDVMDVDAPGFEADFSTFRDVIRELERRLGALIMQVRMSTHLLRGCCKLAPAVLR